MEQVVKQDMVDVLNTVMQLRQLRPKLVQTQEQYQFIYQVNIYIHSIPDKAAQAQARADSGAEPIHLSGQYLYPLNS
jgi:protein tyrosine phosphatase